ncbi:SDR family oxidoreductase [Rhodococcus rhodochrous]|uniref:SDR family oxidoreductase n=1 Tax=Rhodococcus rhodochrous TaxID=1829 RepID=UPI0012FE14E6|nr:SDR family oxidoreductase [Rhodococcus rhodochrous]
MFITGASRGIGRATAELFGQGGATVFVNYKSNEQAAKESAAAVEAGGGRAHIVQGDVGNPEDITRMFERVDELGEKIDVMVVNAASTAFKTLMNTKAHNLDLTFAIAVRGSLLLSQEAAKRMPNGGSIVMVSGPDTLFTYPLHGVLGAAKSSQETMVRYLAVELGPQNIRVNAINPGFMDTESSRTYMGAEWPNIKKRVENATPLGRVGTSEDMAGIIELLAGSETAWITGQTIVADGGVSLGAGIPQLIDGVHS